MAESHAIGARVGYDPMQPPLQEQPRPCPRSDPSRRAVVTGLGAVTPIGNDHPTFWRNLVAGVSGGGPITSFDASGFDVRIAAEVKDFDPTVAMDRKMARRMSRFIHLGMAAGKEAVPTRASTSPTGAPSSATGWRWPSTPAAAAWSRSSTARTTLTTKGPALRQPVRHPGAVGLDGGLPAVHGVRPHGPGHHPGRGLRQLGHLLPRRAAHDPARRGGRRPRRRLGGAAAADGLRGARQHGRAVQAQRRPGARLAAVRPATATASCSARAPASWSLESRAEHALARGATIQAEVIGAALTADAFHISAPEPTGRGAAHGHDQGHARRRARARRGRLHRGPRHVHAAQRRHRDARHQGGVRRPRPRGRHLLAQVDGRAPARRGRA